MAAVATVMTSFSERELDATRDAAVAALVLDPVVNDAPTWLIRHVPHVHATLGVAHVQALVISASASYSSSVTSFVDENAPKFHEEFTEFHMPYWPLFSSVM